MEEIIHKYLSLTYEIGSTTENSKKLTLLQYDAIFKKSGSLGKEMVNGNVLLKELVLYFYIDEVTLKKYVSSWVKTIKKNINLDWYWSQCNLHSQFTETLEQLTHLVLNSHPRLVSSKSVYDEENNTMNVDISFMPNRPVEYIETKLKIIKSNLDLDKSD